MAEARMPTTVPSPADRGEFRFVEVDAAGATWHWIDEEMLWARQPGGTEAAGGRGDGADAAG